MSHNFFQFLGKLTQKNTRLFYVFIILQLLHFCFMYLKYLYRAGGAQ